MSSHGDDDLFGDGDSRGSLFGDDNDSLFDGSNGYAEEQTVSACSSTLAAATGFTATCLSLPSFPDPHDALSCSHVGHTSGQHTVSTQDPSGNVWGLPMPGTTASETTVDAQVFRDQAIDTFPVASHNHGYQAGHGGQGEITGESPEPSPSKDGLMRDLERMLQMELAQDQDSHDQPDQLQAPAPVTRPDTQPTDDTEMLMEYNILRDQAARATTTSLGDQPADIGISLAETNHRWAEATCRRGIRLPRRIDFEGADVDVLKPYITLNRGDSAAMHYERLELPVKTGKDLLRDLKEYITLSPDAQHLKQKGRLETDERRTMFLTAALRLLKTEGWGAKWFGPSSPAGNTRTLVWPSDSSLIVMRFAGFLYKVVDQAKYRKPGQNNKNASRQSTESHQPFQGHSQAMPIDLTTDDNGFTGVLRGLTPSTSVCSSRPASSHMSQSQASTSGIFLGDQLSQNAFRRPSLALPAYKSPAFNTANPGLRPDFYIVEEPSLSENDAEATNGIRNPHIVPIRTGITLAKLAEEVAGLKQQKKKPTQTRPVKYRLKFTDSADAQDLRPPVVGVLADEIVRGDKVVKTIRSAFSRAGVPATIYIEGAGGPVEVSTQEEWNEAVQAVWLQHGDGAVVEVGIHV